MFQQEMFVGLRLPFKNYMLVVPLIAAFLIWLTMIMMAGDDIAAPAILEKDQDKESKIVALTNAIYYYFWEEPKPKTIEEPNYFKRLWNYVMP